MQSSIKMACFTAVELARLCCSKRSATSVQRWFCTNCVKEVSLALPPILGLGLLVAKKYRRENLFTNGTSRLLKLVAFVLRGRRIQADDQVGRLWNVFLRHFFVVHRNPQGTSDVCHRTMWRVLCYAIGRLSLVQISTSTGVNAL
jgi:hypothetical protein